MTILKKNGNRKIKNYFDYRGDSPATLKHKRGVLTSLKLDTPLFSWPKDRLTLLSIINTYLANLQLAKLDREVEEEKKEKLEVIDDLLDAVGSAIKDLKENKGSSENKSEQSDSENSSEANSDENKSDENNSKENETNDEKNSSENQTEEISYASKDENIPDYIDEKEYADLPGQIFDIEEVSAKMLGSIVRILNFRSKVLQKISILKENRAPIEMVNAEIEKVAVYNIVLAKYLPILNKQRVVEVANLKNATNIFEDVCTEAYEEVPTDRNIENEIKKNKEEQDFDIVSALNYVGVGVEKNADGSYYVKNANNGNGIKYYIGNKEKAFTLSKKSCEKFIDNFLNRPIENRKFITPGQVFIAYISEAEKSFGINTRSATELNNLFGTMNASRNAKAYFKDAIKKYSRNAQEWKDFQKLFEAEYYSNKESKDDTTNRIHIKQQAKRLVIGQMFEEFLNEGDILSPEQLSISDYRIGDVSQDFGLDIDLDEIKCNKQNIEKIEDGSFRIVSRIHSSIQDMRAFVQDIIDNYTVDYLRKEKIFLLQQDDQNEFISKKKEFESLIDKLSYDKAKDSSQQITYYQTQVDELTQKIGSVEYREAKEDLLKTKNNFRILLLNAKSQKELVKAEINTAIERASSKQEKLSIDEKIKILKEVLTEVPEYAFTFDKGKVTYYNRHKEGEQAEKKVEKLSDIDKIIEETATRISDESHKKILEENKIREAIKKSQKEDRVKSVNAYINAYGSILGNATGVGGFNGFGANFDPSQLSNTQVANSPTFAKGITGAGIELPKGSPIVANQSDVAETSGNATRLAGNSRGKNSISPKEDFSTPNASSNSNSFDGQNANITGGSKGATIPNVPNNLASSSNQNYVMPNQMAQNPAMMGGNMGMPTMAMPMGYMMPNMMAGMQYAPNMYNRDYQAFDSYSDGVEPCVIPFVVGYENKGVTTYGNMLEDYATFDRYKFLLLTNNNLLYSYLETKKAQIQTPEQIISDLHIRYIKNAMAKSGLSTIDSNLSTFDYKSDLRKFLSKYVPQNMIDIVTSDYNDLIHSVDFDLLRDLIDHKFKGDLETYVPEKLKENLVKCAEIISTLVKTISSDMNLRKTYEEYSSKMKQTYINSLIQKIESNEIPTVKVDSDTVHSRMIDYLSFSTKGQNVIIQSEDEKDSGFATYPRSSYFKQKENADTNIKFNRVLSFEQNEIVTTRNEDFGLESNVTNLFGTLYKFNGGYNKLLLKLKPYYLASGVKFMENMVDALREKINVKTTVIVEEDQKPAVTLVKFASKEKAKRDENEIIYDYNDDKWYVRKGFVLDKDKVKEYALLLAFGRKYVLDKEKTQLKEDFYKDGLLNLGKINEKFSDCNEETRSLITSVIRNIMMSKCERWIDFIDQINKENSLHFNRMLYINRMLMESNSFDRKTIEEKKETIESLESGFNSMSEDILNPHPEIYSSIEEIEHYEYLYLYYALNELFEKYGQDERLITKELENYFEDKKKDFRNTLLTMIRDRVYMNGYELEMAEYFELNIDKVVTLDDKPIEEVEEISEEEQKTRVKIKNIDVIFKGIYDGFTKATKNNKFELVSDEIEKLDNILSLVGTLPSINSDEKDLEIALPNNQTIICNIKGFIQQYLFRFIVDKEHELGPFAYVVKELIENEEFGDIVRNLEEVAKILNEQELGINLIAKFSSINLSNNGNVFKIGDNISTVVETINRLKTPTDMQKALNRDVFYREGVNAVQKCFEQYFTRRKLESMK